MKLADELREIQDAGTHNVIAASLALLADYMRQKAAQGDEYVIVKVVSTTWLHNLMTWANDNALDIMQHGLDSARASYVLSWGQRPLEFGDAQVVIRRDASLLILDKSVHLLI